MGGAYDIKSLYIGNIYSPNLIPTGSENLQEEFNLSNCYCFVYNSFLFHGWNNTPRFIQNRIAFITVLITAMVCYWHWEAMIISYLAVRKIILPYESFEQLLSKSSDKVNKCIASTSQVRICVNLCPIHRMHMSITIMIVLFRL